MPPRLTNAPLIEGDQRSQGKIVLQNQGKEIPFTLSSFSILAGVKLKTELSSHQQVYIYIQNRLCQRLTKARGIIGCVSILLGLLSFYYYYYFICSPKPMMANTFFD